MEQPTAVVGRRVAAFLIDGLVVAVVVALLWILLTDRLDADTSTGGGFVIGETRYGFEEGSGGRRAAWIGLSGLVVLAVWVVLPGLRGTSPGRRLTGIRLVRRDGRPPGVGRALLRYVLWIVDSFPYFIPYLVGFVVALATKAHQRVGDMAAGTFTVRAEAAGTPIEQLVPALAGDPAAAWQPMHAQAGPGWYADPHGPRLRWWDGSRWTEHTSA